MTVGTLTLDNPEDFEQMIREICRDELKKAIAEKVGGLTKFALGLVAKTAISQVASKAETKPNPELVAKLIQEAIAKMAAKRAAEDGS